MADHFKTTADPIKGQTIRRYDGSFLNRPFDLPKASYFVVGICMIAALIIGSFLATRAIDDVIHGAEKNSAEVTSVINRGVTLDLPSMPSLAVLDNGQTIESFAAAGFNTVDLGALQGTADEGGLDIVKLPSDVSAIDAGVAYTAGFSNLSASDAAKYLSGSWRFQKAPGDIPDVRIKYADFTSGTTSVAIETAMNVQGLTEDMVSDSGKDASGNTFKSGSVSIDGTTYTWSVSACPLSAVYTNIGLPENAQYVGVRING